MGNLHPSSTAKRGHRKAEPVTRGLSPDLGPYFEAQEVFCKQCGMACNLGRDARNVDNFVGEASGKYTNTEQDDGSYEQVFSESSANEITNGGFEDWTAGSPDDWTVSGTVTQNTTDGYYDIVVGGEDSQGSSSLQATYSGSTISLSQTMGTPSNFNSNIVRFKARVKCTTKDVVRLKIVLNSTTYTSSYNRGQQRFEDISLVVTAPATVTSLTASVLLDSGTGTAYIDNVLLSRNGNPITTGVSAGCPHCGSYNYY